MKQCKVAKLNTSLKLVFLPQDLGRVLNIGSSAPSFTSGASKPPGFVCGAKGNASDPLGGLKELLNPRGAAASLGSTNPRAGADSFRFASEPKLGPAAGDSQPPEKTPGGVQRLKDTDLVALPVPVLTPIPVPRTQRDARTAGSRGANGGVAAPVTASVSGSGKERYVTVSAMSGASVGLPAVTQVAPAAPTPVVGPKARSADMAEILRVLEIDVRGKCGPGMRDRETWIRQQMLLVTAVAEEVEETLVQDGWKPEPEYGDCCAWKTRLPELVLRRVRTAVATVEAGRLYPAWEREYGDRWKYEQKRRARIDDYVRSELLRLSLEAQRASEQARSGGDESRRVDSRGQGGGALGYFPAAAGRGGANPRQMAAGGVASNEGGRGGGGDADPLPGFETADRSQGKAAVGRNAQVLLPGKDGKSRLGPRYPPGKDKDH